MQATMDVFNERLEEISLYYEALEELYSSKPEDEHSQKYYEEDFLKVLKSNALLMIYNLVESTIIGGMVEIYESLQQNGATYRQVRREIQDIWFGFKFSQVYDKKAHYHAYREKAMEIINAILSDEILSLDRKAANISGNLDADAIRQVCHDHGIAYHMTSDCRGGIVLTDVREKRNNLAHGTLSFVECGRDYTIEDLKKIKREVTIFLSDILNGMKDYYDRELYLR